MLHWRCSVQQRHCSQLLVAPHRALVSALTGTPAAVVDMGSGLLPASARSLMQFWLKRKSVAMRTEEVGAGLSKLCQDL